MSTPHTKTGRLVLRPLAAPPAVGFPLPRTPRPADASVTQRIYTHLFDQTHGEVLAAVAGIVNGGSAGDPLSAGPTSA